MNRYFDLPCDLCAARLPTRREFDRHCAEVHGVTSLKPRNVLMQARRIMAAMPRLGGRLPISRHSGEGAPVSPRAFGFGPEAPVKHRFTEEALDREALRRLQPGLLTAKFAPRDVDDELTTVIDESRGRVKYHFASTGSRVQFADEAARRWAIARLRQFLAFTEREAADCGDPSDFNEVINRTRRQIAAVEAAEPHVARAT